MRLLRVIIAVLAAIPLALRRASRGIVSFWVGNELTYRDVWLVVVTLVLLLGALCLAITESRFALRW